MRNLTNFANVYFKINQTHQEMDNTYSRDVNGYSRTVNNLPKGVNDYSIIVNNLPGTVNIHSSVFGELSEGVNCYPETGYNLRRIAIALSKGVGKLRGNVIHLKFCLPDPEWLHEASQPYYLSSEMNMPSFKNNPIF